MRQSLSSEYWTKRAARKFAFLQTEYGFDPPLSVLNAEYDTDGHIWWRLKRKYTLTIFVESRDRHFGLEVAPYQPKAEPGSVVGVVRVDIRRVAERLNTTNDAEFANRMRLVRYPLTELSFEEQLDRWAALLRIDCESMLRGNTPDWDSM